MEKKQHKLEALAQANGFTKTSEKVTFTFDGYRWLADYDNIVFGKFSREAKR